MDPSNPSRRHLSEGAISSSGCIGTASATNVAPTYG